jgi:hypothetical protein
MEVSNINLENELELTLPIKFNTYDIKTQENIIKYLKQLEPIEKKAYMIGVKHLGSSFNLLKSNGFNDWIKSNS